MMEEGLMDTQVAAMLNDTAFFSWLSVKQKEDIENIITVKGSKALLSRVFGEGNYGWIMKIELTNNSTQDISASDYSIGYTIRYDGQEGNGWRDSYATGTENGLDLKAGETKTATIKKNHVGYISSPKIEWNLPIEQLSKFLTFTGMEYSEYKESKK